MLVPPGEARQLFVDGTHRWVSCETRRHAASAESSLTSRCGTYSVKTAPTVRPPNPATRSHASAYVSPPGETPETAGKTDGSRPSQSNARKTDASDGTCSSSHRTPRS